MKEDRTTSLNSMYSHEEFVASFDVYLVSCCVMMRVPGTRAGLNERSQSA